MRIERGRSGGLVRFGSHLRSDTGSRGSFISVRGRITGAGCGAP